MPLPLVDVNAAFQFMLRTVEVVTFASRAGEERRNVFHYRYADGSPRPTAAELSNLLADVELSVLDQQENTAVVGTVWYQITARDMEDVNGQTSSRSVNRVGAGGSQVFPGSVSFCLSKRTTRSGGSFRGRFYLFDLSEDFFNGDDLNPFWIPGVNNVCAALLLPRQNGRFVPSVGSRRLGGSTPIQAITYDLVADTQIRRGKGRGR